MCRNNLDKVGASPGSLCSDVRRQKLKFGWVTSESNRFVQHFQISEFAGKTPAAILQLLDHHHRGCAYHAVPHVDAADLSRRSHMQKLYGFCVHY